MLRKTSSNPGDHAELPNPFRILLGFFGLAFLLYSSIIHNAFLSDDYDSLYRILVEHRILYKGVLRPLIDISFYINYLISGLHTTQGYYLFNLVVHALTAFMVYQVALKLEILGGWWCALGAGILFLCYPFHNESVVWLSGRLSSMAALCALAAIFFSLRSNRVSDFLLAAFLYAIGLFAYESILMLPLIILVLKWPRYPTRKKWIRAILGWGIVFFCCLGLRLLIAGTLLPSYGSRIVPGVGHVSMVSNLFKAFGRSLLPPMENSDRMTQLFLAAIFALAWLHFLLWKKWKAWADSIRIYLRVGIVFLLAMIPAVVFGVSTRTSEGDRLLYFPSCFLCILAVSLIYMLIERDWRWWGAILIMSVGGIYFIVQNNRNWIRASQAADGILDRVQEAKDHLSPKGHVVLINVPDELEGAFVFRHGLDEALAVYGVDTTRVFIQNYLPRLSYLRVNGEIEPVSDADGISIYPATRVRYKASETEPQPEIINLETGETRLLDAREDSVYYWNKLALKRLILK